MKLTPPEIRRILELEMPHMIGERLTLEEIRDMTGITREKATRDALITEIVSFRPQQCNTKNGVRAFDFTEDSLC